MENPIQMDDFGVPPFQETSYIYILCKYHLYKGPFSIAMLNLPEGILDIGI